MVDIRVNCRHFSIRIILVNQFFLWNLYLIDVCLWAFFPLNFSRLSSNVFGWLPFFKFLIDFVCLGFFYHSILWLEVFLLLENGLFRVLFFNIFLCFFFVQFRGIQFCLIEEAFHACFFIEFFLVWFFQLNLCHNLSWWMMSTLAS